MAITGYIRSLFADREKTSPLFPITKTQAVINDDGKNLDDLLIYSSDEDIEAAVDVRDADTLGGVSAANFVQKNEIKAKAGFIYPLATPNVPDGFLLCDGAAYSRTEYVELFAAIGTYYGEGDGSTTFNVPNLQTRVPVGAGDNYALGDVGGEETHTLTTKEMPSHKHIYTLAQGSLSGGSGHANWSQGEHQEWTTDATGGGQAHNNMQPYTVVNYIIATGKDTGVYVSDIINGVQTIPLEIQYGGTGATNADDARKNLGVRECKQNLLDNSDFTNPVNQRGASSYSENYNYTIDRWVIVGNTPTLSILDGEVSIKGQLIQAIEKIDINKTYTLAAMTSDGLLCISGVPTANVYDGKGNTQLWIGTHLNDNNCVAVAIYTLDENIPITVEWAALYEGEYTTETLPPYVPKGYSAELLECQRYYIQFGQYITLAGYRSTSNYGFIFLPTEMRATPTATFTTSNSSAYVVDGGNSSITEITSVTQKGNSVRLTYTTSGTLTNYRPINANFRNLKMSADL